MAAVLPPLPTPLGPAPFVTLDAPLPRPAEAAASAAGSDLLRQVRVLVDFLGEGRKLTRQDHLTLADARALVPLLGTGDLLEVTVDDRTHRARSSNDLPGLRLVVAMAEAAGWTRTLSHRLVPTRPGRAMGERPLADLSRLLDALIELGPASACVSPDSMVCAPLAPVFDRMVEPLLILLLTHVEGVAHTGLIDRAAANLAGVLGEGDGVGWTDELRWSIADQMITTVVDVLDLAGVLRWDGAVVDHEGDDDGYEVVVRSGGFVALTPAGRWLVAEIARDRGLDVTAPRLTAASFADLVPAIVGQPFPVFAAELEAWLAARPPGIAVDELVAFAATADAAQRTMALAALSMLTEPEAGLDDIPGSRHRLPAPAVVERVRSLLEEPAARGAALVWLSERGGVRPEALVDPDPAVLTDVLLNALVLGGPTRVVEVLRLAGDPGAQIARVQQMTAVESPSVPTVLDVLGAEHPIAAVAKACRKAALQNRSRMLVG